MFQDCYRHFQVSNEYDRPCINLCPTISLKNILFLLIGQVITQVTCGSYHTAAVSNNGKLYTWGGGKV